MAGDLEERIGLVLLRNSLRERLSLREAENALHLKSIGELSPRIAARTREIRALAGENDALRAGVDAAAAAPPAGARIRRALENYAFAESRAADADPPALAAALAPDAAAQYRARVREFEADLDRREREIAAQEAARAECRREAADCERAARVASDEIAEHQAALQQMGAVQAEIDRLAEFCGQRAEREAEYARLQAAYRDAQIARASAGPRGRFDAALVRDYLDAVAERDRLRRAQADWAGRLGRLLAALPGVGADR